MTRRGARLQGLVLFCACICSATADVRDDGELARRIEQRVQASIEAGEVPGAVVIAGVVRAGDERRIAEVVVGARALEPEREELSLDTVFDLASLTKPLATATAVLWLAERGKVELDAPVARYIEPFGENGKDRITVRQLLLHRGGLAPADGLAGYEQGPEAALARIVRLKPDVEPGSKFVYSDLGYIVLGELVRVVDGRTLDVLWKEEFSAIGARFLPDAALHPRCAPTERGSDGDFLRGAVHDPRARALGGVAGHAGLFGTADDVARWCRMVLARGVLDGERVLSEASIAELLAPSWLADGSGGRTVGLDVDTPYASARGWRFARGRSMGHTGFTGTSLWLDPASGAYVVVLTNRVHPNGEGKVVALRRDLATIVAEHLLGDAAVVSEQRSEASRDAAKFEVLCGIDVLVAENFERLAGRRVALVTNASGLTRDGGRTLDVLHAAPEVELVRILSPEHGLWANREGDIEGARDDETGLAVHSLYGETRRPTDAMLEGLDTVVFDVQDAGVRIYTYATTLAYVMEEAGKRGVGVMVLDRPNPLGGERVDGPRADADRLSFISYAPIPFVHGLTIGELAGLFRARYGAACELEVVRMQGWRRSLLFTDTDLTWTAPSPNLRTPVQTMIYPALGLLEATNVSVGRGTDAPFEQLGAPWIDGALLAQHLEAAALPGVRFEAVAFTPESSAFAGKLCSGVVLRLTDSHSFEGPRTGFTIAWHLERLFADDFEIARMLDRARSFDAWRALRLAEDPAGVPANWAADAQGFHTDRAPFLLYD